MRGKIKKKEYPMVMIFLRMIKETFRATPGESSLYAVLDILHALSTVLTVIVAQNFFDSVAEVANGAALSAALLPLVYFLLGNVWMEICNGLANFSTEYLSPRVLTQMYEKLHQKAAKMDAIAYENPDFLDQMNKAKQGIESGYLAMLFALSIVTFYLPSYIVKPKSIGFSDFSLNSCLYNQS